LSQAIDFYPCLVPLLEALEWRGEQQHFLEALPFPRENLGFSSILNTMSNLHFQSEVAEMEISSVQSFHFPCFFVNEANEAYVILKREHHTYLIFDNKTRDYREVNNFNHWGRLVFFKPIISTEGSLLGKQTNWFVKVLNRFQKALWLSFTLSFFMSLLAIASPALVMFLYSHIQAAGPELSMGMISVGVGIYLMVDLSFRLFRNHLFNYIGARLSYIVGSQVMRRILYLHPSKTSSPSVASQLSKIKEFESIHEFMSSMALPTLFDTFLIIVLIIGLAIIGGELAYIPIAGIVVFIIFGLMIRSLERKLAIQSSMSENQRNELLSEMVTGMRFFKTTGIAKKWLIRFKERSMESALNIYTSAKVSALVNAFSNFLIQSSGLVTVSFGVIKVLNQELSTGGLMGVMLITFRILTPLKSFFNTLSQFERFNRSVKQIDQFMNMELEIKDEEIVSGTRLHGDIKYSNIYLKYSTNHLPALQNLNLNILRGQFVNLCGPSGSGRSSLFKVLMDLAQPQAGQVFVDGINVKQLSPIQMRYSFAHYPREIQLFEGTLLENILFAAPATHEQDIEKLLKRLCIWDDIRFLENGLNTLINPSQHNFTENFVRKIGLVRTLIKHADILLIDKPEIALTKNDLDTLGKLLEERRGVSTIITISNNPEVLKWADRAILMDKGRVTHDATPREIAEMFYAKT